jgi:hypothetical protein
MGTTPHRIGPHSAGGIGHCAKGPEEMDMRQVHIYGNVRQPSTVEWVATALLDEHGTLQCTANINVDVYDAIEASVANGDIEGTVNSGTITYTWSLEETEEA